MVLCDLELLWGPGGVGGKETEGAGWCQKPGSFYLQGPRFSWAASRRPDGAQKLGLPLDCSHTAAQFDLKLHLNSLGFFVCFLVNLRPSSCLFQEAGGKRVGGSREAGPMPFSCWAGLPAVGAPRIPGMPSH